ncbi:MAG TPA: APC family permease [Pseudonocardiaceae bacterium]|nr:APC family permease [Pseudonocardiaceae bacterium]
MVAQGSGAKSSGLQESVGYVLKRLLLGRPMINEQLKSERLSNPIALGVLSSDAMSSTAYGTEEILVQLLPYAGLAAFSLLLPITGAVLVILVLVAASYRQVVTVYTKAGGSYVVARDNFGPRVAQIAAAALLIDYVVTVAVQCAAGTVAVVSAIPALGPYSNEITIGVVLLIAYLNLRGLREAGKPFAMPAFAFVGLLLSMIVVGVIRAIMGNLPVLDSIHQAGAVHAVQGNGLLMGASIFVVLQSFANGGSSLTGVEAISNTVSAFRKPEGINARKVLTVMATLLGVMVAGVSFLAYKTHASPFSAGYPSVLSQEATAVFGSSGFGRAMFWIIQLVTALILYTGGNTSFNGFPFLASFVAEDRFLPRKLTKRGHRLVFSNGIIVLTVLSVILLLVVGANVDNLVPFYAIGVFTGFSMAGYGMAKHHTTHRTPGWRRRFAINLSAGIVCTIVVLIFAITKFTEGAWLIVVVFPLLVFTLIRLNREYRTESAILDRVRARQAKTPNFAHHKVFIFVSNLDLAVLEALRYGRGLRGSEMKAVHFMVDEAHADRLRQRWADLDINVTLKVIDCPDRRITRAAQELVFEAVQDDPSTGVTVLLPRRSYAPLLGRLLHDRTADRIARVISRIPQAAATIVPYDVQARIRAAFPDLPEERLTEAFERLVNRLAGDAPADLVEHNQPKPAQGATPIGALFPGQNAIVQGRLHEINVEHRRGRTVLTGELREETGSLLVELTGDHPDIEAGVCLRVQGRVRLQRDTDDLMMANPHYEITQTIESDDESDGETSTKPQPAAESGTN